MTSQFILEVDDDVVVCIRGSDSVVYISVTTVSASCDNAAGNTKSHPAATPRSSPNTCSDDEVT